MAKPNDQVPRLTRYVELLKQRLAGGIPEKHAHRPEVFKDMLKLDIKKTQAKIDKLKG